MTLTTRLRPRQANAFRHEAFLYAGRSEFFAGTVSFIRDAVAADEPVLVVVTPAKIDLLRSGVGDVDSVFYADMGEVGRNPARIIPAWRDFVAEHAADGRRLRGIGEPIWPGRSAAELVECQRHERLLNVAFADGPPWWLMCPYDRQALEPEVIEEAQRSHPFVRQGGQEWESPAYGNGDADAAAFAGTLPEPPERPSELVFGTGQLDDLRRLITRRATSAGLDPVQTADLVLAVNEVATNSLRHGGGQGTVRMWQDGDRLICEVRDAGHIQRPLVGRERPSTDKVGDRGLWLVNQLCDLVQVRSSETGTVVRLHMWQS